MKRSNDTTADSILHIPIVHRDRLMNSEKWREQIPFMSFPPEWTIQITPPFNHAVVRFRIRQENANVSVFLDCYELLGSYGEPYWDVSPYEGDNFRCKMNDTEALLRAISSSLKEQNSRTIQAPLKNRMLDLLTSKKINDLLRRYTTDYWFVKKRTVNVYYFQIKDPRYWTSQPGVKLPLAAIGIRFRSCGEDLFSIKDSTIKYAQVIEVIKGNAEVLNQTYFKNIELDHIFKPLKMRRLKTYITYKL